MLANVKDMFSRKQDDEYLPVSSHQNLKAVSEPVLEPVSDSFSKQEEKSKSRKFVFDRLLIKDLEEDHKLLLCNFEKLMECAREGNFLLLSHLLGDFTVLMTNHLNKEDNELYGYLEQMAKEKNETEMKVFRKFRSEMKNISVTIFSTVNQNTNIPVTDKTADGFIKDFTNLGEILIDRIQREESILYPMYKRSRKVVNIS